MIVVFVVIPVLVLVFGAVAAGADEAWQAVWKRSSRFGAFVLAMGAVVVGVSLLWPVKADEFTKCGTVLFPKNGDFDLYVETCKTARTGVLTWAVIAGVIAGIVAFRLREDERQVAPRARVSPDVARSTPPKTEERRSSMTDSSVRLPQSLIRDDAPADVVAKPEADIAGLSGAGRLEPVGSASWVLTSEEIFKAQAAAGQLVQYSGPDEAQTFSWCVESTAWTGDESCDPASATYVLVGRLHQCFPELKDGEDAYDEMYENFALCAPCIRSCLSAGSLGEWFPPRL